MEIRVYFCAILYNEDSEIIQVTDVKKQDSENSATSHLKDTKTTLSALYKDGWRLIQAVLSPDTNGYRLFLERE